MGIKLILSYVIFWSKAALMVTWAEPPNGGWGIEVIYKLINFANG